MYINISIYVDTYIDIQYMYMYIYTVLLDIQRKVNTGLSAMTRLFDRFFLLLLQLFLLLHFSCCVTLPLVLVASLCFFPSHVLHTERLLTLSSQQAGSGEQQVWG